MTIQVLMPQLGESVIEGTVAKWLIAAGQPVRQSEPLLQITTDKVDTELPAPASGILLEILVEEGQTVPKGTVLAVIGTADDGRRTTIVPGAERSGTDDRRPAGGGQSATPLAQRMAAEHGIDLSSVMGTGSDRRITKEDIDTYLATETDSRSFPNLPIPNLPASDLGFISPVVSRLAAELGVDLAQVIGTGAGGRITKKDVLAYVAAPTPREPISVTESPVPSHPSAQEPPTDSQIISLSPMRLAIARHMTLSAQTAPQVTTVMEADMTHVVATRERLRGEFERQGVNLTFTPFLIQAIVAGLRAMPEANSSFRDDTLLVHRRIHIGMAVALSEGLIVPVIRDADDKSLLGLARTVNDLAERAAQSAPITRRRAGRHLHADEPWHLRQPARHVDHRPVAGWHPGRGRHPEAAGGDHARRLAAARCRGRHRHPADGLSELHLRPSRARRRGRRSLSGGGERLPGGFPGMRARSWR